MTTLKQRYRLPDGPATLVRRPGVHKAGKANDILLQAARRVEAGPVLILGPGAAATALWAAHQDTAVTYWTENLAEAQSVEDSFKANALPPPKICFGADFADLQPGHYALALCHMPRGSALQTEILQLAAALLQPGGRLVFVGATREGIKGVLKEARAIFRRAGIVIRKGGYHAGLARRPGGTFPPPTVSYTTHNITVDDTPTRLVSCPGVFAGDRLDDGAAALIAGMVITPGSQVLDLGCGTGLVGLSAVRAGAQVTCVDVSARAVETTRRTLAANDVPNARVCASCGAEAVYGQAFDTVVTNPPFHKGHGVDFEVARMFIADAARVLRPGGNLYLVANAFLRYQPWLTEHFSRVKVVWQDKRFQVWEGTHIRRA